MKLIHTSDWHLGRPLHGRRRHEEHEKFLRWLLALAREERADAILVAGDVFDTVVPNNTSQEQYYNFLCEAVRGGCKGLVITAGNHDSPSFLDAPRGLLKALNVHVVGRITKGDPEKEIVVIQGDDGERVVVAAIPYLRDGDVSAPVAGESGAEADQRLVEGIKTHYREIVAAAARRSAELGDGTPIIVMGHLFAAGGVVTAGDGVKELYVGNLARVGGDVFSDDVDFAALGHLHRPQLVQGCETRRYCGAPIPMDFSEADTKKAVYVVEFQKGSRKPVIREISIPVFKRMARIKGGGWPEIEGRLSDLKGTGEPMWVEIVNEGTAPVADFRRLVETAVEGSSLEVLVIRDNAAWGPAFLRTVREGEALEELTEEQVFERRLESTEIPAAERDDYRRTYREALRILHETDVNAGAAPEPGEGDSL